MDVITTNELLQKIDANERLSIIDVREQEEVATGMIPGAIHIPLNQVETSTNALDSSVPQYIVCRAGGRSAMACEILEEKGFSVTNVAGGMLEWEGELQF